MEAEQPSYTKWLDKPVISIIPRVRIETFLAVLIILAAVFSRFFILGARVMSHDEVNHVVPSWDLFSGSGYRHDPVTHGPFQFHVVALSYFLFGDNDFTSRIPAALFSIGAVCFVLFAYRRYLGRTGALIAGFLNLISPFMLFYGRYTRNEAFIMLFGVVMLFAVLRYLEEGKHSSLYLLSAAIVLHFCAKETAYIYTAQLLLFTAIIFLRDVMRTPWKKADMATIFIILILVGVLLTGASLGLAVINGKTATQAIQSTVDSGGGLANTQAGHSALWYGMIAAVSAAFISFIGAIIVLVLGLGLEGIRAQRSFDILILIGTLVLPLLSALPVALIGWDPLNYQSAGLVRTGIVLGAFGVIAVSVGLWWKPKVWIPNAILFYGIFTVLFTTFFTNGQGFFTGLVGALGYWIAQQGVERGSQPWYYYSLIQIPMYEYLGALGTILAVYFGARFRKFFTIPGISPAENVVGINTSDVPIDAKKDEGTTAEIVSENRSKVPVLMLLVFWSITSLVAYSIAGEKMPWLTVHIALPLLLTAGWGLGFLIDRIDWKRIKTSTGLLAFLLVPVFIAALAATLGSLLGVQPPFQGKEIIQLEATATFFLGVVGLAGSGAGIIFLLKDWNAAQLTRFIAVGVFGFLAILTARSAFQASFINYDYAREFLVYAHAAPGPKEALTQIEEISLRTTGGFNLKVSYDNDMLYPYWWYLRDYPNHEWYGAEPTGRLRESPIIVAGEATMNKLDSIIREDYVVYDYVRLWWPMQDYFNLTFEKVWNDFRNPQMRAALFQIWLNKDYSQYATLKGSQSLTSESWQPSSRMRLYIRKDIIAQIWNYGSAPVTSIETETDPYLNKMVDIRPNLVIGTTGQGDGQFRSPRGIAVAPDGSIYVADTNNNRIQHFSQSGELLNSWGTYADISQGEAPGGTFYEPWGIAVGLDGSVFVADTWNNRIQKFSSDGQFVTMWGRSGLADAPDAFYGPRGIAVDSSGRVYITDTGNKRVVVFSSNGEYISQFGTLGVGMGQFDEPVGIGLDKDGNVYIADTWNQRIQVFEPDASRKYFAPVQSWDMYAWFGQSLDNKPYISVDKNDRVFAVDPEGYRVLVFDSAGEILLGWGQYSVDVDGFGLPAAVAIDSGGSVWVTDAGNNRILRFDVP